MKKHLLSTSLALGAGLVQAHSGHGLPGSFHWHADDALLLMVLALMAAIGLWLARQK